MTSEQTSEYTMGTEGFMKAMEQVLLDRHDPADIVCLNLGTIIRNCVAHPSVVEAVQDEKRRNIETDRPAKILLDVSVAEITKVVQTVIHMIAANGIVHNPYVITYAADYSRCVPKAFYRTPTHGERVLTLGDHLFRMKHMSGSRKTAKVEGVTLIEHPVKDAFFPWRHLYEEVKDIKNDHRLVMVSHHPVDYHIGHNTRSFRLVRSHTGEIVSYKNLSKTVFKTELIPFNIYTHPAFGDKVDIQSKLSPLKKDILLEAEKDEWRYKTRDYIKERFFKLGIKIPFTV